MSDTQQGPDWWLASDGRWYPPTSAPGWVGAHVMAPSRALSIWLQIILWAMGLFGAMSAIAATNARSVAEAWNDNPTGRGLNDWSDANDGSVGTVTLLAFLVLIALILTIVWMNAAHKHEAHLEPGHRKWSSGWTVGAWFIPVANFVLPKLVLNEIERIAVSSRGEDGTVDPHWSQAKLSGTGHLFWLGWVAGSVGVGVSSVLWDGAIELSKVADLDMSAISDAYLWHTVGGIGLGVAGVFGALHFRRLTRLLADHDS